MKKKKNTFSCPGQRTFFLNQLTKGLDIIEESSRIRIDGVGAKGLEEFKATAAFVDLILHEMRTIFFGELDVSIRSNEETPVQQVFDPYPYIFVLFHIVPMFVCRCPCWVVVVSGLDEIGDERADLQEMMENRLNCLDELDPSVSRRELKYGLCVEVCREDLTNVEKAWSHGIFDGVCWGARHLFFFFAVRPRPMSPFQINWRFQSAT